MEFYTVDSFKWKLVMVIAVCISYTEQVLRNFHRDYIQRPVQEDEEHIHWQTQVGKLVGNSVRPDVDIKIAQKVALPLWLKKWWLSQLSKNSPNIWATLVIKFVTKNVKKSPNQVTLVAA